MRGAQPDTIFNGDLVLAFWHHDYRPRMLRSFLRTREHNLRVIVERDDERGAVGAYLTDARLEVGVVEYETVVRQ